MNPTNTKSERNRKTLKKLSVYASIVTGGALGVLLCYKVFEFLFTHATVFIGSIGQIVKLHLTKYKIMCYNKLATQNLI